MMDSIKKAFVLSVTAIKVFTVMVVFNIIVNIINLMVIPAPGHAEMDIKKSFTVLGIGLLFFLAAVFMQGGIIAYIRDLVKTGSANLSSFIGNCGKYFLRMLGMVLITVLIVLGWGILFFGALPLMVPALKTLFVILGLIFVIGMVILLILPAYALVGSELGAIAAIRKGVSIAISNFMQTLGILAVLMLVTIVVMLLAFFITGILAIPLKQQAGGYIAAVALAVSSAIATLLTDIAYMDFYLKKS